MVLINFLNLESNEKERFRIVINSLEHDRITPLVKNILNRLKEVDHQSKDGRDDKTRRD